MIYIDKKICVGCGKCAEICSVNAIAYMLSADLGGGGAKLFAKDGKRYRSLGCECCTGKIDIIQRIGAGFIPDTLNTKIFDEVFRVTNEEAFQTTQEIARTEGLLVGFSSGAALFAAKNIAARA